MCRTKSPENDRLVTNPPLTPFPIVINPPRIRSPEPLTAMDASPESGRTRSWWHGEGAVERARVCNGEAERHCRVAAFWILTGIFSTPETMLPYNCV